jgi:hypothetical protein
LRALPRQPDLTTDQNPVTTVPNERTYRIANFHAPGQLIMDSTCGSWVTACTPAGTREIYLRLLVRILTYTIIKYQLCVEEIGTILLVSPLKASSFLGRIRGTMETDQKIFDYLLSTQVCACVHKSQS